MVSFRPKSEKTRTSSWETPKEIYVVLAVSEVGDVIVAEY